MLKGYFLVIGKKAIFMESGSEKKNPAVVYSMIEAAAKYRGLCEDWIDRIKNDKQTYKRIQQDMIAATLEYNSIDGTDYYYICGKGFYGNYNPETIIMA